MCIPAWNISFEAALLEEASSPMLGTSSRYQNLPTVALANSRFCPAVLVSDGHYKETIRLIGLFLAGKCAKVDVDTISDVGRRETQI